MRPLKSTTQMVSVATSNPYVPAVFFPLVGVATLAAYTVNNWLAPIWPVVLGFASTVPFSLAITVYLNRSLLRDWENNQQLHRVAIIIFGIGAVLPSAWVFPSVRQAFLHHAGAPHYYRMAMDDWSSDVQETACRMFVLHDESTHKAKMALADNPSLAQSCLTEIVANSTAKQIAIGVTNHWHQNMVNESPLPAARRCQTAQIMPQMPVDKRQIATNLLDCVLRSPSSQVRRCCTDSAAQTFGQCGGLLRRVVPNRLIESDAVGPLVGAAFGQEDIRRRLGSSIGRLGLDCTPARWFSTKLLCDATQRRTPTRQDGLFFQWLMSQNEDCLEATDRELDADIGRICTNILSNISPKIRPGDAICEARRQARKAEATARRAEVGNAKERAQLASRIAVGSQMVNSRYGSGPGGGKGGVGVTGGSAGSGDDDWKNVRRSAALTGRAQQQKHCLTGADISRIYRELGQMSDAFDEMEESEEDDVEKTFDDVLDEIDNQGMSLETEKIETMELVSKQAADAKERFSELRKQMLDDPKSDSKRRKLLDCIRANPNDCPVTEILDRPRCKSSDTGREPASDASGYWQYHQSRMDAVRERYPDSFQSGGEGL